MHIGRSKHPPSQKALCILLLACLASGCRKPAPPAALTFLGAWWLQPDELPSAQREFTEFTKETGIAIKPSAIPETLFSSLDPPAQLTLLRQVLHERTAAPDVLGIDVIWPATLADNLIDLRPEFATELSSFDPQLVSSYTVHGKVVAVPYRTHVGVLAYRKDLLRRYGYSHPPQTWDELESMAARIQAGERAQGKNNFWGYVWQGSATEGLACNALEWQAAEGGGRTIEEDGTVSVNNPAAIRSWQRAAHWIGWISPPGVVAYRETDSLNAWDSGNAAFLRSWVWPYLLTHPRESAMRDKTGYTSMPGGPRGRAATLGGYGLAVSRSSPHPGEAIALIRFLLAQELQSKAESPQLGPPSMPELYEVPQVLAPHFRSPQPNQPPGQLVGRPSNIAGQAYQAVSTAYIKAVHSVLTREQSAPQAAAELEKQLVALTGFKTGPPQSQSRLR